jgi:hypothetical protein
LPLQLKQLQSTNKLEKLAHFSPSKKRPSTHHVYHAFHPKLTTKAPQAALVFRKKPQQKPSSTGAKKAGQLVQSRPAFQLRILEISERRS